MKSRTYILLSLVFWQSMYACEESESKALGLVDITPLAIAAKDDSRLTEVPYAAISSWCNEVSADGNGIFSAYRILDEKSVEFKNRQQAVEKFADTCRDDSVKARYYSRMLCYGMAPGSKGFLARYCHIHHCYEDKCFRLYAYQAYLLQPKDISLESGSVHEAVWLEGGKQMIRSMAPQSESNGLKKVFRRQLGMR